MIFLFKRAQARYAVALGRKKYDIRLKQFFSPDERDVYYQKDLNFIIYWAIYLMKLTVSKDCRPLQYKSCLSQMSKPVRNQKQRPLQMQNQRMIQGDKPRRETTKNEFSCNQGFFSKCLPCPTQKGKDPSNQQQIHLPYRIEYHQQKIFTNQSPSTVSKAICSQNNEQNRINMTKKVGIVRIMDQRKLPTNRFEKSVKLAKAQLSSGSKNKNGRQVSVVPSLAKEQINSQPQSVICSISSQQVNSAAKKINLTIWRKSKQPAQQWTQIAGELDKQKGSKKGDCQITKKNLKGSFTELQIEDPFDEFKSLDTEYLKNKISFSQLSSERQQLCYQISESIFYIPHQNIKSSQIKEIKSQCGGYKLGKQLNTNNQGLDQRKQKSLQQSIVLEQIYKQMFDFSIPKFSKLSTSEEKPNYTTFSQQSKASGKK